MKKPLNEVLEILDGTIANMKTLKESEFDYSDFVSDFNLISQCGTVCCVAGWYPKWYPKSAFSWKEHNLYAGGSDRSNSIAHALSEFHGLSCSLINVFFFGDRLYEYGFLDDRDLVLLEVIERFEKMRNLLASGEIPLDYAD